MDGNYEKSVYNQLMDVMKRFDAMKSECQKSHKEIKNLHAEIKGLRNENTRLKEELAAVKAQKFPVRRYFGHFHRQHLSFLQQLCGGL